MAVQDEFADDAAAVAYWRVGAPDVATTDLTYPGGAGQAQAARIYRANADGPMPALLYIHGGGWTGGSIDINDRAARMLAHHSGCHVFSVSYRLTPEHPFPAGLDDCAAALTWLRENGADHGIDVSRIAAGGASAGANLAMALALAKTGELGALLLFYGVFGCDFETDSYQTYADGFGLTRARMVDLFAMYDPGGQRENNALITPLKATELAGLPPSWMVAAEHDVLRDDTVAMANAMTAAGVVVESHTEPGVTHGFINRGRLVPAADAALVRSAAFLKTTFE